MVDVLLVLLIGGILTVLTILDIIQGKHDNLHK